MDALSFCICIFNWFLGCVSNLYVWKFMVRSVHFTDLTQTCLGVLGVSKYSIDHQLYRAILFAAIQTTLDTLICKLLEQPIVIW